MPDVSAKHATARQVELLVRRLNCLSTFPQVAATAFGLLCETPLPVDRITELVGADPALTVRILSLAAREGLAQNGSTGRIDHAIERLEIEKLREAVISMPVQSDSAAEPEHALLAQTDRIELTRHALAVACASRRIAELILPEELRSMATAAGLLHDLGKLALAEVMPRSFARLIQQARIEGLSLARVEQQHLGMDHTRIGKQLAEKWNLPEPIRAGIWLHHSDPSLLTERFASAKMAQVVAMANWLAKKSGLGDGGLYHPELIREAAFALEIPMETVERIGEELAQEVEAKCRLLGLGPVRSAPADAVHPMNDYYQSVHTAASVLARENLSLASLTRSLRQAREQMELAEGFLSGLEEPLTFERIVASLARLVHGREGNACALVVPMADEDSSLYCHLTDRQGRQFVKLIYPEAGESFRPEEMLCGEEFQPVPEPLKWVFEKMEQKLDLTTTRLLGLMAADRPIGQLLIEFTGAMHLAEESPRYRMLCRTAAHLIACAAQTEQQKGLSEQMVEVIGSMQETGLRKTRQEILEGVAEMAAGAAHELNNPLSVISGRVQQLKAAEQDPQRKELLDLIETKSEEMSRIVKDLAEYARPRRPEKKITSLEEILAISMHRLGRENIPTAGRVEFLGVESMADTYVDSVQIAEAIMQVLKNALQADAEGKGPVRVEPAPLQPAGFSAIMISDQGVGIEPQVLSQVFEPFFSHQPAGRRRGMGLAHARRLITLNGGSIRIDSTPHKGTRVTIQLPGI